MTLNTRQINFLQSLETAVGRPETITRKELLVVVSQWSATPNLKGGQGLRLRWPAWLTNSGCFTTERGAYRLPWSEMDAHLQPAPSERPLPSITVTT